MAVDNFCPVSLTGVVVKLLEHLKDNDIISFLSHSELLCDSQCGFRPLCSCVTQLLLR